MSRWMLLATLVIWGCSNSVAPIVIEENVAENKVVQFIEKLRGKVTRDEELPDKPVIAVALFGTKVTDAGLQQLAELKSLHTLNLGNTRVADAGLKELAGLTKLTTLGLHNTRVTDAGLQQLAGLTNLTLLTLDGTQITDAGLQQLAGLTKLTRLFVRGTQITDAGVAYIGKVLPNCKIVITK